MALAIIIASSLAVVALGSAASVAGAVSGKALINRDTVTGSPSVEQTIATSLGLDVTVVSGSAWDAMTASDFAGYRVLIVGDPSCAAFAASVTSNRSVWASAVMATAGGNSEVGNRVVWGADAPSLRSTNPGIDTGIKDGIAFAAGLERHRRVPRRVPHRARHEFRARRHTRPAVGRHDPAVGGGSHAPSCGRTVSLVGTGTQFADLNTAALAGPPCSGRDSFPMFETDFVPLAIATDSVLPATCGTDLAISLDGFIAAGEHGIGATLMGRNMFGPIRGPWGDDDWRGWWGDEPPYHHPVFVLTHHSRPPINMEGGTTFCFVNDGIEAALERAFDAASGLDVRLGGGASTIQQYLRARLIDEMHVAIVPTILGRGERLFDHLDGGPEGYDCEFVCSPAVVHARLTRR